jgi:glycosyltransferase involved in cell wall biosynthesis
MVATEATMKILMVHPHDIYHDLEPWTVRITYLAKALLKSGHDIKLVYHDLDPFRPGRSKQGKELFPFPCINLHRIGPRLAQRCFQVQKLVAWSDIVHFQKCTHYSAIPSIFGALCHDRPVHYDWDDWEQKIFEQSNRNPIGSWIYFNQMERWLPLLVDTISVASEGLRALTRKFNIPQDRVFYIPVGADIEHFTPERDGRVIRRRFGESRKIVMYHGQISGANYVHLFIKAAEQVLSQRNDVLFVVVGGGDQLGNAKDLARCEGLGDGIYFTGEVPHSDIPDYIAAADVTIACFEDNEQSRCKSPLKVVEYLASGKAIVASRLPEVEKMIGDAGILVTPDQPSHIAEAVATLLDNDDLRAQLGAKARRQAEKVYNWPRSADTLQSAYERAFKVHYGLN